MLFWQLLKTDLIIYRKAFLDSIIDCTIWFACVIVIFTYVFPSIGLQRNFNALLAVGAIVSCSFWDVWSTATNFVADLEGNQTITYYLTLPISNNLVLIKQILGYAVKAAIPSLVILPLSKLFLWNDVSFSQFSFVKFAMIFCLINIFTGAFSLFVTSTIQDMTHLSKVGTRYLFPLWFFGGSNYSWAMIYKLSPPFAYCILANPLIYASEGIRVSVLGHQEGNIPFLFCAAMLLLFSFVFCWIGINKLKKRLDFV